MAYPPSRERRLLYPGPFLGELSPTAVGDTLEKVYEFWTLEPVADRVMLRFDQSIRLLVAISSQIGEQKNWKYAGALAQVLADQPSALPGEPKKAVVRVYLDQRFLQLDGLGYSYYLEFWPVRWLTDYRLELWAQLAVPSKALEVE